MKRIDPPVDELMWLIAEQSESAAVDAFAQRYPEHRTELLKRLALVRELKGSRPDPRPARFQPRAVRPLGTPRWAIAAAASSALALVAFGSYAATRAVLAGREPAAAPAAHAGLQNEAPPPPPVQAARELQPQAPAGQLVQDDVPPVREEIPPAYLRPVTVRLERIGLHAALRLVGEASGVEILIAPGTPDPEIACDYRDTPALALLQDMGRTVGFTPFAQGDGTVLIIPAVDAAARQGPVGTAAGQALGGSAIATGEPGER
jgi:hypothetical protein